MSEAFSILDYGEECMECGETKKISELFDCEFCGEPICQGCEVEHYLVSCDGVMEVCHLCGIELEVDPVCPCCGANFCDGCFKPHVESHKPWEYPQPKSQTRINDYNFWSQW